MTGATLQDFLAAWPLFGDAILAAAAAGLALGWLGVYVVLARTVFAAAAITQAAGFGVALAYYAGIHMGASLDPAVVAGAVAMAATALFAWEPARLRLSRDALVGLVFAAAGAGTVLLGSRIAQEAHDIQAILFGSAVLVERGDALVVGAVAAAVMALAVAAHRGLVVAAFDPLVARVQGVPVAGLETARMLAFGAMVGVAGRALGALPAFAAATLPAVAALLLAGRLRHVFVIAGGLGAAAGPAGYYLAFAGDWPVGASQAAVLALAVVAAAIAKGVQLRVQS